MITTRDKNPSNAIISQETLRSMPIKTGFKLHHINKNKYASKAIFINIVSIYQQKYNKSGQNSKLDYNKKY